LPGNNPNFYYICLGKFPASHSLQKPRSTGVSSTSPCSQSWSTSLSESGIGIFFFCGNLVLVSHPPFCRITA
jgi:hypothetical protein